MKQEIYIENLKCGGCANTVTKGLEKVEGVSEINVDVEKSLVSFVSEESVVEKVRTKLASLGYPEVGDKNTLAHKAKSFVSCATGKMTK